MCFVAVLNPHMENRTYAAADHIILADYALIHIEFFKERVPFGWSLYPHLNHYYEHMR